MQHQQRSGSFSKGHKRRIDCSITNAATVTATTQQQQQMQRQQLQQ
jgi:hypothetical protein